MPIARDRVVAGLVATLTLAASCAPLVRPTRPPPVVAPETVLDALAARERAMTGARVSMRVRSSGPGAPAGVDSPAYLAVDGPGRLRLQVLSIVGVTVLELGVDGAQYTLSLPLRGETHRGDLDPSRLSAASTAPGERMIIALALLFRPRISRERCTSTRREEGDSLAVVCRVGPALIATTIVDDHLRPLRETFADPNGTALLIVEYDRYETMESTSLPGRITMRDPTDATTMIVRVLRVRRGAPTAAP